jgi:hypothetical protein
MQTVDMLPLKYYLYGDVCKTGDNIEKDQRLNSATI